MVEDYLSSNKRANIFGITATTPQVPCAIEIGDHLKGKAKKTILGGPHVTLMHAASKREKSKRFGHSEN